jgi:hypothetical protein
MSSIGMSVDGLVHLELKYRSDKRSDATAPKGRKKPWVGRIISEPRRGGTRLRLRFRLTRPFATKSEVGLHLEIEVEIGHIVR